MTTSQFSPTEVPPGKVPLDHLLWLKEIRNRALAKQTGISEQMVSLYRRGLRPKDEDGKKIAKALGVSQADLGWGVPNA